MAADFDELPDVALPGQGAPLVASMVRQPLELPDLHSI